MSSVVLRNPVTRTAPSSTIEGPTAHAPMAPPQKSLADLLDDMPTYAPVPAPEKTSLPIETPSSAAAPTAEEQTTRLFYMPRKKNDLFSNNGKRDFIKIMRDIGIGPDEATIKVKRHVVQLETRGRYWELAVTCEPGVYQHLRQHISSNIGAISENESLARDDKSWSR